MFMITIIVKLNDANRQVYYAVLIGTRVSYSLVRGSTASTRSSDSFISSYFGFGIDIKCSIGQ